MFLKSVTESVLLKLPVFTKNGNEGVCDGLYFLWAVMESAFSKALGFY